MNNWLLALGGSFGAIGVISGALGSHVLKASLAAADFANFTTAVSYLLLHSVVLLLCGILLGSNAGNAWFKFAGVMLVVGIVLFCGGLIIRTVTGIPAFGQVVPVGGSALILAWLAIALGGIANFGQSR